MLHKLMFILNSAFLVSSCEGVESDWPSAAEERSMQINGGESFCESGFHRESVNSPVCVPNRREYGEERRFEGTMILAHEQVSFVPSQQERKLDRSKQEFWLSFSSESIQQCLASLGARHVEPLRLKVAFSGHVAKATGRGYGHMGAYPGEIRVADFVYGNPCS